MKREPALILNAISTILALLIGFQVIHLDDAQTAAVLGVCAALIALAIALLTEPAAFVKQPALFLGALQAGLACALALGADVSPSNVGKIMAVATAAFAVITRQEVKPLPAVT